MCLLVFVDAATATAAAVVVVAVAVGLVIAALVGVAVTFVVDVVVLSPSLLLLRRLVSLLSCWSLSRHGAVHGG